MANDVSRGVTPRQQDFFGAFNRGIKDMFSIYGQMKANQFKNEQTIENFKLKDKEDEFKTLDKMYTDKANQLSKQAKVLYDNGYMDSETYKIFADPITLKKQGQKMFNEHEELLNIESRKKLVSDRYGKMIDLESRAKQSLSDDELKKLGLDRQNLSKLTNEQFNEKLFEMNNLLIGKREGALRTKRGISEQEKIDRLIRKRKFYKEKGNLVEAEKIEAQLAGYGISLDEEKEAVSPTKPIFTEQQQTEISDLLISEWGDSDAQDLFKNKTFDINNPTDLNDLKTKLKQTIQREQKEVGGFPGNDDPEDIKRAQNILNVLEKVTPPPTPIVKPKDLKTKIQKIKAGTIKAKGTIRGEKQEKFIEGFEKNYQFFKNEKEKFTSDTITKRNKKELDEMEANIHKILSVGGEKLDTKERKEIKMIQNIIKDEKKRKLQKSFFETRTQPTAMQKKVQNLVKTSSKTLGEKLKKIAKENPETITSKIWSQFFE